MAYPRRSSSSPGSRARLGLLVLTALSLLALDLPGTGPLKPIRNVLASAFQPIRSAGDAVLEPFSNGWKGAFGYDDLKAEKSLADMMVLQRGSRLSVQPVTPAEWKTVHRLAGVKDV